MINHLNIIFSEVVQISSLQLILLPFACSQKHLLNRDFTIDVNEKLLKLILLLRIYIMLFRKLKIEKTQGSHRRHFPLYMHTHTNTCYTGCILTTIIRYPQASHWSKASPNTFVILLCWLTALPMLSRLSIRLGIVAMKPWIFKWLWQREE